ncbi:MAG TPA: malto-oligosyltrehalose synthase [Desulfobacterales bacterium]|nr:malto-oligosyltrehalose synthase [Desulfobacterales bacterium]
MGFSASKDLLATYRLQLGPDLPFEKVCDLLPYFRDLGITHLYLSPCLKATAGSTHGYDVVDPAEVNPHLGGREGFERLCGAAAEIGVGLVLDIVPNHMAAAGRQNPWWWGVLANGRHSGHAAFFDIRWDHPDPSLRGKVLLPVLGDEITRCLASRQIQLRRRGAEICVAYFEHEFPLSARSLRELLQAAPRASSNRVLTRFAETLQADTPQGGAASAGGRPPPDRTLTNLSAMDDAAAAALDAAITALNADPVRLERILDLQYYRLAFWRHANRELNYRRFFDIHQLAGVSVEREEVFAATHELILRWVNEGRIDGLRVDHPDGLRDPTSYLKRLRTAAGRAWIVVEKILEPGESLAPEWPVDGTTGYDFLNRVSGLFVDSRSEQLLSDFYGEFTGQSTDYQEVVHAKKLLVLGRLFGSELSHLADLLEESRRRYPGPAVLGREDARRVLAELIACFPVYRTYIRPDTGSVGARDQAVVGEALTTAMHRQPDIGRDAWRLIEDALLLKHTGQAESEFVLRFQQLTGPVMAKGAEDTSFYCFNRMICLNEVGGNPGEFGTAPDAFHAFCGRIQAEWPQTMLASATHDTKRGEDTRLRIGLLSEVPQRWVAAVRRWSHMNARFRRGGFPDANTEYFFYQALAGAWPIGCDRLGSAMLKAAKEAKVHTSWTDPDPAFEEALRAFVVEVLGHADFTTDLAAFLEPLAWPAVVASLSQTLIKCTAPGVPDIYQGSELWDLNLMDPDNRRPVDFELRRRLLTEIDTLPVSEILDRHAEGLPKLFLLQRVLSARRRFAEAFGRKGDYRPLAAEGERSGHLVAYMRGGQAVTLAPRRVVDLNGDWRNTVVELPAGTWKNVFSGERFSSGPQELARMLECFPVALLVRKGGIP